MSSATDEKEGDGADKMEAAVSMVRVVFQKSARKQTKRILTSILAKIESEGAQGGVNSDYVDQVKKTSEQHFLMGWYYGGGDAVADVKKYMTKKRVDKAIIRGLGDLRTGRKN